MYGAVKLPYRARLEGLGQWLDKMGTADQLSAASHFLDPYQDYAVFVEHGVKTQDFVRHSELDELATRLNKADTRLVGNAAIVLTMALRISAPWRKVQNAPAKAVSKLLQLIDYLLAMLPRMNLKAITAPRDPAAPNVVGAAAAAAVAASSSPAGKLTAALRSELERRLCPPSEFAVVRYTPVRDERTDLGEAEKAKERAGAVARAQA